MENIDTAALQIIYRKCLTVSDNLNKYNSLTCYHFFQVPKTECKKVPDKKCTDIPIFIPRKACKDFPKTVCVKDPINVPKKIPKKVCYSVRFLSTVLC